MSVSQTINKEGQATGPARWPKGDLPTIIAARITIAAIYPATFVGGVVSLDCSPRFPRVGFP